MKGRTTWTLEIAAIPLFLLVLLPFFFVLIGSAKTPFEVSQSPFSLPSDWSNLWRNIVQVWTDRNIRYQSSFVSSLVITAGSLSLLVLLTSQAAWALVRTRTRLSGFVFVLFVAAMVVPFQILMLPLVAWFRMIGDTIGIRLLRDYSGMFLAYVGFGSALSIFIYHGFIKGIPLELEEAAAIDGSSQFATFYRVVFPNLAPVHVTVIVLNGIWIWNDYLLPLLILGKGRGLMTVPLAVSTFAGAYVKQWHLMMTAILMAMVPVIIVFLFCQRYIVKGMIAGAIK